jgi:hypothetical protein
MLQLSRAMTYLKLDLISDQEVASLDRERKKGIGVLLTSAMLETADIHKYILHSNLLLIKVIKADLSNPQ